MAPSRHDIGGETGLIYSTLSVSINIFPLTDQTDASTNYRSGGFFLIFLLPKTKSWVMTGSRIGGNFVFSVKSQRIYSVKRSRAAPKNKISSPERMKSYFHSLFIVSTKGGHLLVLLLLLLLLLLLYYYSS